MCYLKQNFIQKEKFRSFSPPLLQIWHIFFWGAEWVPVFDDGDLNISPPPPPVVFWEMSQIPESYRINQIEQSSLYMCSEQPTVKSQAVTVSCPQLVCRRQGPKLDDETGRMRTLVRTLVLGIGKYLVSDF